MMGFSSFLARVIRRVLIVGFAVTIAACAGPEKAKPADLGANTALIGVRSVWSTSIGAVNFPLDIRVIGNTFVIAGSDGNIAAIDGRTGGDLWRVALGTKLSAGVGSDGRYSSVVSREVDHPRWRQRDLASETKCHHTNRAIGRWGKGFCLVFRSVCFRV
jgi:outer membrane protein assembly factor BamB